MGAASLPANPPGMESSTWAWGPPGAMETGAAAAWEQSQSLTRSTCVKETVLAGHPHHLLPFFSPACEVKAGKFPKF